MVRLFLVVSIMCASAYFIQRYGRMTRILYAVIVITYILFVGLRTSYNDTSAYIKSFMNAEPFSSFMANPQHRGFLHNPLFHGFKSWLRGITDNYHVFFMIFGIIDALLLVRFISRHSYGHFAYAILMFWAFGLGMFGAAAMKQITAMAILSVAYDKMIEKKWISYLVFVLIAALVHTYALLFLIMPFFITRPWNWKTMLLILATSVVLLTFNQSIMFILDYADDIGRPISANEVLDGVSMNVFRVSVYAILPLTLFIFRHRLIPLMNTDQRVLANMCIISFMFIVMGYINGANMFGRLSTYFIFGYICLMGWTIEQLFNRKSQYIIFSISIVLFLVFFWYDNRYIDRAGGYACISLFEFVDGLLNK